MSEKDFKVGNVVKSGLCYGYTTDYNGGTPTELPLMVANIIDLPKDKIDLVGIISNPHTFVAKADVHGIELNEYVLRLLGFKEIDLNKVNCPGSQNMLSNLKTFEATISGKVIQIIQDGNNYQLARSKSSDPTPCQYIHEIQNRYIVEGTPLPISYTIFYPDLNK